MNTKKRVFKRRKKENFKRLALVNHHPVFRHGLAGLLRENGPFEISFEAANGIEALDKLKKIQPDLILMDTEMPLMNGVEATEIIRKNYPGIKILIMVNKDSDSDEQELMNKGCNGCLSKEYSIDIILEGIDTVFKNNYFFRGNLSKSMLKKITGSKMSRVVEKKDVLTEREKEILQLICQELNNKEIAGKLSISTRTVERHRENIQLKTGARNTVGLVMYAVKNQLIV